MRQSLTAILSLACVLMVVVPPPMPLHAGQGHSASDDASVAHTTVFSASPVLYTAHLSAPPVTLLVDRRTRRTFVFTEQTPPTGIQLGVSVLDGVTGHLLHAETFRGQVAFGGAVVDPRSGQVFVLTGTAVDNAGLPKGPSTLRVLDGTTGAITRILPAGESAADLALDAGRQELFILDAGPIEAENDEPLGAATVRVLSLRTGRVLRTYERGLILSQALGLDARTQRLFTLEPAGVHVLNEVTGAHVADVQLANAGPFVVDEQGGRVFVENGVLTVLDARTGAVVRNEGGTCDGPLAVDSTAERVVCLDVSENSDTAAATLQTLDPRSGHAVRTQVISTLPPLFLDMAVDEGRGHTLIVTGGDVDTQVDLNVFDTRSGRLLRDLTVGPGPDHNEAQQPTVGVDAPDGRVYVGNGNNNTVIVLAAARL